MVLENLSNSLKGTLAKIAKSLFVDETLVNELVKDIQRSLLQADVNVRLVFQLTNKIKERILKEQTPGGLSKREYLINVVYEELVRFLGEEKKEIIIEKKPFFIMLVGLFGSGKTTTAGKLAHYFMKRGKKVAVVGLDVHRPAAMHQLQQVAEQVNVPCFIDFKQKNAVKIFTTVATDLKKFDVVLVDTAGRDALSTDLITEIRAVGEAVHPDEVLLVLSADIGQAAQSQAQAFHESCGVTGVIITKMDGTAKGGGALSACAVTAAPVKFIGVGEKSNDLEEFNPKGFVGRLLGMGDLEALLSKVQEAVTEEDAKDLEKKLLKGEFTLLDLYQQMEAMNKMGPLGKVLEMIPGMGQIKIPKEALNVQQEKMKVWRYAMDSMTRGELEDPDVLTSDRVERISKGSGIPTKEIRDLVKQYRQSKKMIKMFKGNTDPNKLMQKMQRGQLPKGLLKKK